MNPACWFCESPDCDGCVYLERFDSIYEEDLEK